MDKQTTISTLKRLVSLISAREELDKLISYGIDDQTKRNLYDIKYNHFKDVEIEPPSLTRETFDMFKGQKKESAHSFEFGIYLYCALGFVLLTIAFLPQIIGWTGYLISAICVFVIAVMLMLCHKMRINNERKRKLEIEAEKKYAPLRKALKLYDQQVKQGVAQMEKQKATYPKAFEECLQEIDAAEKRKSEVRNQISNYSKQIAEIDLIAPQRYHLVDNIIDLLESGRADNCKEALNIAVEEEQQRIAAAEREEAYRQAEESARREKERLGMAKCNHCQNRWSCPEEIRKSGAGLTCGGYKPYGT